MTHTLEFQHTIFCLMKFWHICQEDQVTLLNIITTTAAGTHAIALHSSQCALVQNLKNVAGSSTSSLTSSPSIDSSTSSSILGLDNCYSAEDFSLDSLFMDSENQHQHNRKLIKKPSELRLESCHFFRNEISRSGRHDIGGGLDL